VTAVAQSLHTGSHIDSPLHCYAEGGTTAEIPLERVIGEAFVLDCSHIEAEQPIEVRDLEAVAGGLQEDDILIIRTDWTDRSWGRFPEFFTRSPYLTPEAAEWVIAGVPMLEQITGLGQIGRPRFDFFAPFYKIAGTEGAPARYFALLSDG